MNEFSSLVKNIRKDRDITQQEAADLAGVGLRFIRDLEQGKASLRLDKVNQVLQHFGKKAGPVECRSLDALHPIAQRYVWWKEPHEALENSIHFLCQVMTLATWDDARTVFNFFGKKKFIDALLNAPPGVFNQRSWHYWYYRLGFKHVPPLPSKNFN